MSRNLDRQQLNRFGTIIQQLLGERKGKGRRLCSCVLVRERTIIRIPDFLTIMAAGYIDRLLEDLQFLLGL
jgi:hypothetical protein